MKIVSKTPSPLVAEAYKKVCETVQVYGDNLTPLDLLALFSQLVGRILALQDQTLYTHGQYMAIVSQNIISGNEQMIQFVEDMKTDGNA